MKGKLIMTNSFNQHLHELAVKYSDGEYYVYVWFDSIKNPFYVGMGKGNRYKAVEDNLRSRDFMKIYNKGGCSVKIIAYSMKEYEARAFEKSVILAYNKKGVDLVNKQYLVAPNNSKASTRRKYWIVDGEIKTAQEWCSRYNITYSAVFDRVSKGLTLKEALIYPKINRNERSKVKPLEFWRNLGLKPGTDMRAKDLGNLTIRELENVKAKLSLGQSLFGYDVKEIIYDIL